jgi:hypothetical protein
MMPFHSTLMKQRGRGVFLILVTCFDSKDMASHTAQK